MQRGVLFISPLASLIPRAALPPFESSGVNVARSHFCVLMLVLRARLITHLSLIGPPAGRHRQDDAGFPMKGGEVAHFR